jgi:hypothetical protein
MTQESKGAARVYIVKHSRTHEIFGCFTNMQAALQCQNAWPDRDNLIISVRELQNEYTEGA